MKRPGLLDILLTKHYFFLFEKFLKKIHATESLAFYVEVELFKRIKNGENLVKETFRIYDKFIKRDANYEINVEGELKGKIKYILENATCWDNTLFDEAHASVFSLLETDCLPAFLKSDVWLCYKSKTKLQRFADKHKPKTFQTTPTHSDNNDTNSNTEPNKIQQDIPARIMESPFTDEYDALYRDEYLKEVDGQRRLRTTQSKFNLFSKPAPNPKPPEVSPRKQNASRPRCVTPPLPPPVLPTSPMDIPSQPQNIVPHPYRKSERDAYPKLHGSPSLATRSEPLPNPQHDKLLARRSRKPLDTTNTDMTPPSPVIIGFHVTPQTTADVPSISNTDVDMTSSSLDSHSPPSTWQFQKSTRNMAWHPTTATISESRHLFNYCKPNIRAEQRLSSSPEIKCQL